MTWKTGLLLQSSEYSEDTKWRLLELIHNPVRKFQELFHIYENNRTAFDVTFQKNKAVRKTVSQAPSEPSDVICALCQNFIQSPKDSTLQQCFPSWNGLHLLLFFREFLSNKLDLYQKKFRKCQRNASPILKLLGDKSKFEILVSFKIPWKI